MLKQSLPRELFPQLERLEKYHNFGKWDSLAAAIRSLAWSRIRNEPEKQRTDNELATFMPGGIDWSSLELGKQDSGFLLDLEQGAWLASFDSLPFLPEKLVDMKIFESLFESAYSIAHLVGASFNVGRVLYVPAGAAVELDISGEVSSRGYHGENEVYTLGSGKEIGRSERSSDLLGNFNSEILIIIVEAGGSLVLRSHEKRGSGSGLDARLLVGNIGTKGSVAYLTDYESGPEVFTMQQEYWLLEKDASLKSVASFTGGKQSWQVREFEIEENASAEHVALFGLKGNEQAALITKQHHRGKASKSNVSVRSVLLDSARNFYRGLIEIDNQANNSNADQQQKALIMSSSAKCCAIPSLEVAIHDVQCRHGSAAGRFSEAEMAFLAARGLERGQAVNLLMEGFYREKLVGFEGEFVKSIVERLKERVAN
jgi:hypothetical protein